MKINKNQLVDSRQEILHHLVVHGLTEALKGDKSFTAWMDEVGWSEKEEIEVKLTVEGKEINIKEFCDHWESQVERMIASKAGELIQNQFSKLSETIMDLEAEAKRKFKILGIDLDECC